MLRKLDNNQRAIIRTIVYSDMFDYPLTEYEVHKYLISSKPVDLETVKRNLEKLAERNVVCKKHEYWFLKSRENIVNKRRKRLANSQEKLARAKKVVNLIKFIPWVMMVAVTGGLAMDNVEKDDDIDLLVVTSPNRLWISRIIVVILLKIFGLYRGDAGKVADKICPNLWVSVDSLRFPDNNLFIAHEVAQAKPLFLKKDGCYKNFLRANFWIGAYLSNYAKEYIDGTCDEDILSKTTFLSSFFDLLDRALFNLQLRYMSSKITNELVGRNIAAFHPVDRSKTLLKKYLTRCSEII